LFIMGQLAKIQQAISALNPARSSVSVAAFVSRGSAHVKAQTARSDASQFRKER
jgi:hypothetical protein